MRARILAGLAAAILAACSGPGRSPFVRVTADDGRIYYTDMRTAYHSDAGGFLTFRDLVTKEDVRLKDGTYLAQECPPEEVRIRQMEQLEDPGTRPRVEDQEG